RELLIDAVLRFDLLGLVVDERAELAFLFAGPAADDQDRHALGKGSRYRIHHVVATRAVGDADDTDASAGARIAVGREAYTGLVRKRYDAQAALPPEAEEQTHDEIARNPEQMRHPDLLEVRHQEIAKTHASFHHRYRSRARASRGDMSGEETIDVAGF